MIMTMIMATMMVVLMVVLILHASCLHGLQSHFL